MRPGEQSTERPLLPLVRLCQPPSCQANAVIEVNIGLALRHLFSMPCIAAGDQCTTVAGNNMLSCACQHKLFQTRQLCFCKLMAGQTAQHDSL